MALRAMTVLRRAVGVIARVDPGLWYLLDLRRRSALSWIPAALLLALPAFGAVECVVAGNVAGAAVLSLLAVMLLRLKLRAVAHG